MLPDDPYWTTSVPGLAGRVRAAPEDFVVEEVPVYGASGTGEHTLFWLEKRGLTTPAAIARLAQHLNVPRGRFGWAGLKDSQAVTRQQVSVHGVACEHLEGLVLEGLSVREARPTQRKLRVGHLRGNRFALRLRGVDEGRFDDLRAVLDELARRGVPNWFGPQRFGRHGDTWKLGRDLLAGRARRVRARRSLPLLRFYVSAWQSWLFNRVLARRLHGLEDVLEGDLAWLHDRGAVFLVADAALESERARRLEISASGPLFGPRMSEPGGVPWQLECEVLAEQGLTGKDLGGPRFLSWGGARRPLRVPCTQVQVQRGVDGAGAFFEIAFALPAGSYATAVLREVGKGLLSDGCDEEPQADDAEDADAGHGDSP